MSDETEVQIQETGTVLVDATAETETATRRIPPIGNKRVKAKLKEFCEFVIENAGKRFLICSHDNPDPDSLASALGISWIVQFLDVQDVQIAYCGEVSHPQNKTMITVLDINAYPWSKLRDSYLSNRDDTIVVYVDCASPSQKNVSIDLEPDIVIDHHKVSGKRGSISIVDEVGACATLVLDLMLLIEKETEAGSLPCFDLNQDGLRDLATALAIGIRTDTQEFRSETTSDEDFKAFKLVGRVLSDDKYTRIINYELPPYIFDLEQIAWKNKNEAWAPNLITGLGIMPKAQTDSIPYLADKMMRLKGVQTVVVYAIVEEENAIRASARTVSTSLDCQSLVKKMFGEEHGGAKHGVGGAVVRFNAVNVSDLDGAHRDALWDLLQNQYITVFERITQNG